ncbi:hypothetical protein A33K_13667 [Burkholderia humptydooensis MSMB43]|uniref:Uncharacterized protein n=1 Tax=Burkholderia humptydooensis MSMB43 TaxID=441157 RepID=A0ABN0GCX5_9BURK|nr:hypothetical protein A33K_13667 [Burkholderia humptydooensis MSMB43]
MSAPTQAVTGERHPALSRLGATVVRSFERAERRERRVRPDQTRRA